jgi:hypothetical protein
MIPLAQNVGEAAALLTAGAIKFGQATAIQMSDQFRRAELDCLIDLQHR